MADITDMNNENAAIIAACREDLVIAERHDVLSLREHGPSVPIRTVIDPQNGCTRVEVFADALDALEARDTKPRRRVGRVAFHEVDSLIQYVQRFGREDTIVYANPGTFAVEVVLNEHPKGEDNTDAAWRDHRATYSCPRSPEWIAWCEHDGKPMTQEKFADFIESRLEDLRAAPGMPAPTDVLTMARNLIMRTKGTFERQINPTTGASVLVNKTETDTGSTEIPRAFAIGVAVFEGGVPYQVEARVRLEIKEGRAAFAYVLHRRKEIERDAFQAVRAQIASETGKLVLAGNP